MLTVGKTPARLLFFDFVSALDVKRPSTEEWLQIISISKIGNVDSPVVQKIIRIGEEDQKVLYSLLKAKFEKEAKR